MSNRRLDSDSCKIIEKLSDIDTRIKKLDKKFNRNEKNNSAILGLLKPAECFAPESAEVQNKKDAAKASYRDMKRTVEKFSHIVQALDDPVYGDVDMTAKMNVIYDEFKQNFEDFRNIYQRVHVKESADEEPTFSK